MVYSIDPSVLEVQKGQFLSICGKKSGIRKEDLIRIGRYYDINRLGGGSYRKDERRSV